MLRMGAGAALILLAGCHRHSEPVAAPLLPAASVRVHTITNAVRIATEEVLGTVRPRLSAVIAAQISGALATCEVVPGQAVKAGQLLATLDAREIQARLDQAQAVREQTRRDIARFDRLLAQEAVTQQEYDAVKARERVAEAAVREAQTMQGYTRILAPFDGVITRKLSDVGDLATPGRPLFEMENPAALRLEADVPEALVAKIQLADRLQVRIPAAPASLEGAVAEIAPAADPQSRTFRIKIDLPPAAGLRSGQFGRVAVPVAEVSALGLPAAAVVQRGQLEIVFVAQEQRARMRLVKTGKRWGDRIEIVAGLEAGETVVVEGGEALADGQPLEVRP